MQQSQYFNETAGRNKVGGSMEGGVTLLHLEWLCRTLAKCSRWLTAARLVARALHYVHLAQTQVFSCILALTAVRMVPLQLHGRPSRAVRDPQAPVHMSPSSAARLAAASRHRM